jgi:hypothetical protein
MTTINDVITRALMNEVEACVDDVLSERSTVALETVSEALVKFIVRAAGAGSGTTNNTLLRKEIEVLPQVVECLLYVRRTLEDIHRPKGGHTDDTRGVVHEAINDAFECADGLGTAGGAS